MSKIDTYADRRSVVNIARILSALKGKRMTSKEMVSALYMSKSNVTRYVGHLREGKRRIRIVEYRYSGGRHAPVYAVGSGEDAPCPGQASPKLKYARARLAAMCEPEKLDRYLSKRRIYGRVQRTRKQPATWLSALGGVAAAMIAEGANA